MNARRGQKPIGLVACVVLAWAHGGATARAESERASTAPADASQDPEPTASEDVEVPLVVTSVAGGAVFVDRGRDHGLEPGDRVRFEPPGRGTVIGEVRSVSSGTARVELLDPDATIDVGEPGTVRVPRERWLAATRDDVAATTDEDAPEHPPWTHPPEDWTSDQPLLAPSQGLLPAEREITRRGRVFVQGDTTEDREGQETTSRFARAGVDAGWTNLFGYGGTLDLDLEVVTRSFEDEFDDETDTKLRVQRFSYAFGGDRARRTRTEFGRFLQNGFVEFGLLDGVEVSRTGASDGAAAWTFGASLGLMPAPTFDLETGRDAQIALYARRTSLDRTGLSYGLGYQKTFHDGDADRDLFVFDTDWRPTQELSLHASALFDLYSSGERAVDPGVELTELHAYANWMPSPDWGASASFDRTRPVDTDREPFDALDPVLLREQEFQRVGARVWRRVTPDLRLSVRADTWSNQDDSGGGEVRAAWSDGPWNGSRLTTSVFANEGTFTSVDGLRVGLAQRTDIGRFEVNWELVNSEQDSAVLGDGTTTEQSVRASWDHGIGRTSTSLYAEHDFGDARSATSFGFFLQWRL